MGAVAIGAVLAAALLLIVAAMVWQGSRVLPEGETPLYLIDEAARFVWQRLPDDAASRLAEADVTAILEWGMFHKQVVVARGGYAEPVVGGPAELEYVTGRAAGEGGGAYLSGDVARVLATEAGYLLEIGAIGDPVKEEPT